MGKSLFTISGTEVTLFSIALFLSVLLITVLLSASLQRGLKKTLHARFSKKEGTLAALLRLLHYFILIVGFSIGLQIIGISLSALFAAAAEPHSTLTAIDINEAKLSLAAKMGATHCLNANDPEFIAKLKDITQGNMLDYAIEAFPVSCLPS